jgi:hypothetical protein
MNIIVLFFNVVLATIKDMETTSSTITLDQNNDSTWPPLANAVIGNNNNIIAFIIIN